jgi:hypothetical protein
MITNENKIMTRIVNNNYRETQAKLRTLGFVIIKESG